jgi:hypothetical protein
MGAGVARHLGWPTLTLDPRRNGCLRAAFSREELRMQVVLRRICCLLSVLALVGLVGCALSEPRSFAYETTYSAIGAQMK